jgi:hypothetical protein
VSRVGGAVGVIVAVLLAGCSDRDGAGPVARTSSPPVSSVPATAGPHEVDPSAASSIEASVLDAQRLLESLDEDFTQDP